MSEKDGNVNKVVSCLDTTTTVVHKVHLYVQFNIVYNGGGVKKKNPFVEHHVTLKLQ
jgi:hypothetical protein